MQIWLSKIEQTVPALPSSYQRKSVLYAVGKRKHIRLNGRKAFFPACNASVSREREELVRLVTVRDRLDIHATPAEMERNAWIVPYINLLPEF